jgi:hypothetical protein
MNVDGKVISVDVDVEGGEVVVYHKIIHCYHLLKVKNSDYGYPPFL